MSIEKKNEEAGNKEFDEFIPNNKLYIILVLGAIILTGGSLFFTNNDSVFAIWISITCGCIASIVVAWLIDAGNCRKDLKKAIKNREILFKDLYHVFENDLQLLIYKCVGEDCSTESRKWYEWIDVAYRQVEQKPELAESFIYSIIVFIDEVTMHITAIKNQEAMMLESNIIFEKDIQALSTMKIICESLFMTGRTEKKDVDCVKKIKTGCNLLRHIISYAPSFSSINGILVIPTLFWNVKDIEEEIENHEQSKGKQ